MTITKEMNEQHIEMGTVNKGSNVVIFPGGVIGRPPMAPSGTTEIDYSKMEDKPVSIGDNSVIGANVVIYNDVTIGNNCLIGDGVHIRENVTIGDNCIIGIGCKVGARTVIKNNSRVMDLSNISSDGFIGEHVFIGPACVAGNDNAMGRNSSGDGYAYTGMNVDDYVTIGMNTTILPGTYIGKDTIIGAHSIVTKDIEAGVMAMGQPARIVRELTEDERRI